MRVEVRLRVSDGREAVLSPGAIIGRTPVAALRFSDPTISEAHGLVSLRGSSLRLLSLRGRFEVSGERTHEVELVPGLEIGLGPEITLTVLDVALPDAVLALTHDTLGLRIPPPVAGLFAEGDPIRPGFSSAAEAVLWIDDGTFRVRRPGHPDGALALGDTLTVGPHTWRVVEAPLKRVSVETTAADPSYGVPLTLVLRYDSVHVRREGEVLTIRGVPARILTELALMRAPAEWQVVAGEIWGREQDAFRLRMNWDAGLRRLRQSLRRVGLRPDLVRTDGGGRAELILGAQDHVVDET